MRDSGRWCPCRTRTCVRYVSDSRPTAGRTGHGCRRAEGGGFEPRGLMTPTDFRNRAPATPAAPSRSTFSRTHCSDAYGTRTRTSRIDDPALFHRAHAPGGVVAPESGWPESNPAGSAPRTPRAPSLRHSPSKAREGEDDPPLPGSEPGVLPVTPLPNGASPEARTPIRGVRARSVSSYRRDAGRRETGPLERAAATERRPPGRAEGGVGTNGWRSAAAAGLPPGYGRRGSNSHGPGPPASEAGASAVKVHHHSCVEPMSPRGRSRTCCA